MSKVVVVIDEKKFEYIKRYAVKKEITNGGEGVKVYDPWAEEVVELVPGKKIELSREAAEILARHGVAKIVNKWGEK